jgi:hypothetical protein
MAIVWRLFSARNWWLLGPDPLGHLVRHVDGALDRHGLATSAIAQDRSFALVYLPGADGVVLDPAALKGPHVAASWYDPASGTYQGAGQSELGATWTLRSPGPNHEHGRDWVLVLDSVP